MALGLAYVTTVYSRCDGVSFLRQGHERALRLPVCSLFLDRLGQTAAMLLVAPWKGPPGKELKHAANSVCGSSSPSQIIRDCNTSCSLNYNLRDPA